MKIVIKSVYVVRELIVLTLTFVMLWSAYGSLSLLLCLCMYITLLTKTNIHTYKQRSNVYHPPPKLSLPLCLFFGIVIFLFINIISICTFHIDNNNQTR